MVIRTKCNPDKSSAGTTCVSDPRDKDMWGGSRRPGYACGTRASQEVRGIDLLHEDSVTFGHNTLSSIAIRVPPRPGFIPEMARLQATQPKHGSRSLQFVPKNR